MGANYSAICFNQVNKLESLSCEDYVRLSARELARYISEHKHYPEVTIDFDSEVMDTDGINEHLLKDWSLDIKRENVKLSIILRDPSYWNSSEEVLVNFVNNLTKILKANIDTLLIKT